MMEDPIYADAGMDRVLRSDEIDDEWIQAVSEGQGAARTSGNGGANRPAESPAVLILETLNPRSASDILTTDTPDPEPLVEGLLYPETVLVIGGLVKARKTWAAIQLSLCAVSGTSFLGHNLPRKLRVLYIGGEGSDRTIRKRLMLAVGFVPGLSDGDLDNLGVVSTLGRVKLDTPEGEAWLRRVSEGYDLIVVDPYYRFLSIGSENSHEDQRNIQDVFDRLKATGKGIVVVHHLRKPKEGTDAGAAELRGAGLDAFADSILLLARKRTTGAERFGLRYVLRHDEEPPEKVLVTNGPLLAVGEDEGLVTTAHVVRAIEDAGGRIEGRAELTKLIKEATGAGERTIFAAILKAEGDNAIFSARRQGQGRAKTYAIVGDDNA